MTLPIAVLVACSMSIAPVHAGTVPPAEPADWEVVDAKGRHLGRLSFTAERTFASKDLPALIRTIEAADLRYANGRPVDRNGKDVLRIVRRQIIEPTGMQLRVPRPDESVRRYKVFAGSGPLTAQGTVEVDSAGYVRPLNSTKPLQDALTRLNKLEGGRIDIAPPKGQRGSHARQIVRGTPEFTAYLRHQAASDGVVLVSDQATRLTAPQHLHPLELPSNPGEGGFLLAPPHLLSATSDKAVLSLSGPPGGPLGLAVWTDFPSVDALATQLYGKVSGFAPGPTTTLELDGVEHAVASYRVGTSVAASDHVFVTFRDARRTVALELWAGGRGDVDPDAVLAHRDLVGIPGSFVMGPPR